MSLASASRVMSFTSESISTAMVFLLIFTVANSVSYAVLLVPRTDEGAVGGVLRHLELLEGGDDLRGDRARLGAGGGLLLRRRSEARALRASGRRRRTMGGGARKTQSIFRLWQRSFSATRTAAPRALAALRPSLP